MEYDPSINIYTVYHLHALKHSLMYIPGFRLRDKVALRLLKLYFHIDWFRCHIQLSG